MITTKAQTIVIGREEKEDTMIKKVDRFLFFKTTYWEIESTKHIGNDIYIQTDKDIRNVYINGELLTKTKITHSN